MVTICALASRSACLPRPALLFPCQREDTMTPLRQRFIEDLQLRNRSPRTIETYVFHLKEIARYYHLSPEQLSAEQVHRYLLYLLHQKKASWASYNQAVSALRFFFLATCPTPGMVHRTPY